MTLPRNDCSPRLFNEPQMGFIIFASPKSGTTWLQRLLSHHPEAICAESRAFGNYYDPNGLATPHLTLEKYCQILSNYFAPATPGLTPADTEFYRTLLFNLLDTTAATALVALKKSIYGEKLTPYPATAAHAVEVLHAYHPEIKFVNLIRDGRDVIVSGAAQWLNHRVKRAPLAQRGTFEKALREHTILPEDFDLFLNYWTDAVRAGLSAHGWFPNYLQLSYEQFVADPLSQAARLFEFLGIDANAGVVRACVEATTFERLSGGRKRGAEDLSSFFRKGAVGDWKNWFNDEQKVLFHQRAGDLLDELGYAGERRIIGLAGQSSIRHSLVG